MHGINIEENGDTLLLKFSDTKIPIMERICVIDFEYFKAMISRVPVMKMALYSFMIVESGEAVIEINGITRRIGPRELVCAIPGDACIWKGENNLKCKFIFFEEPFLTAVLKGGFTLEPISYLNSSYHYPFIKLSERRYKKLLELVGEMEESLEERPVFYDMLRVQLWQFVFLTEKEYMANHSLNGRSQSASNRVATFLGLVNSHFNTAHDAKFYAEKMHISPNYLNKLIRQSLGVSAYDYIRNRIFSEAKVLLRLTDVSIKELAYQLGFQDVNYFIRCFKKVEGLTPGEYRDKGSL